MTHDQGAQTEFEMIIKKAIHEGKDGRAEIVRELAMLPLDKLASVPSWALAMIGPAGLAALAARRSEFAGIAPKFQPFAVTASAKVMPGSVGSAPTPGRPAMRAFKSPIVWLCLASLTIGLWFDWLAVHAGSGAMPLSTRASEWPRCLRLDRHTDGCVYRTGGSLLSLAGAASYLELDAKKLSQLNTHLGVDIMMPLPTGSLIIVLRDRSRVSARPS
ncbi:MAG: hypothetical protein KJ755_00865 [Alphaproteobacteria bacterium]|nr:hypothetical protein [Alphaproteobacteria bacterium]